MRHLILAMALGCGGKDPADTDTDTTPTGAPPTGVTLSDTTPTDTTPTGTTPTGTTPTDTTPTDTTPTAGTPTDTASTGAGSTGTASTDTAAPACDVDGDGVDCAVDCDDDDELTYPSAWDAPGDDIDQDCDGADAALIVDDLHAIFVTPSGDDTQPGTMAAPVATLTQAVALAEAAGKIVIASGGTYAENIDTSASLHGGYDAATWTRDLAAQVTLVGDGTDLAIDADTGGVRALVVDGVTTRGEVYLRGGTLQDAVVNVDVIPGSGVTAMSWPAQVRRNTVWGGGTSVTSHAPVVLEAGRPLTPMRVEDNVIVGVPGGWVQGVYGSGNLRATVLGNDLTVDSPGEEGRGIFFRDDNGPNVVAIGHNVVRMTGEEPWGIGLEDATGLVHDNTVTVASVVEGMGIHAKGCDVDVAHNSVRLAGSGTGAALYLDDLAVVRATNNALVHAGPGPGMWAAAIDTGSLALEHDLLWGPVALFAVVQISDPAVVDACAWAGCLGAGGTVIADPLFVSASDLHLTPGSPAVDAGADLGGVGLSLPLDRDGDPRPAGAEDIGSDELP